MKVKNTNYRAESFNKVWNRFMGKGLLAIVLCFVSIGAFAQIPGSVEIVRWSFANDNTADFSPTSGETINLSKTITTNATGAFTKFQGAGGSGDYALTKTGWEIGAGAKFWEVEFSTTGFDNLLVYSKQMSSNTGPRDFKVEFKVGSGNWTDLNVALALSSSSWSGNGHINNLVLPVDADNQASVSLRWIMTSNTSVGGGTVAAGGTSRIDDIVITGAAISTTPCNEPVTAASNLTFGMAQQRQVTLNWVNGNGTSRIVVAKPTAAITSAELPVDGNAYSGHATYRSGTAIGDGYVIFNGTGNSVTVTGLTPGTTYHFAVFEYDCYPANYKTDIYPTSSQTTTCEPTQPVSALNYANLKDDKVTLNWSSTGFGTSRIVIAKAGTDFTSSEVPADGFTYSANSVFGTPSAGIGSGFAVYRGVANSVTVTNLSGSQNYYFRVFEYACSPEDYLTTTFASVNLVTPEDPLMRYSFIGATGTTITANPDANPANGTGSVISRGPDLTAVNGEGAINSSNFPTGGLDQNKYYAFQIAPENGRYLSLTSLELDERRSSTGVTAWSVRSSLDNFGADLATFAVPDNEDTREDNVIVLGEAFKNLTSPVEFRIYGYNAEAAGGTWRIDNVQTFGKITIYPLPVTLISFEAKPLNNQVILTWATATELNNDRFEVQRSQNAESFTTFATVTGKGTTSEVTHYQTTDEKPLDGTSYYRLKQVDFDGTVSYSKIVVVNGTNLKPAMAVYPNPAESSLTVTFTGKPELISIMNMLGQEVLKKSNVSANSEKLDITNLPAGSYQVIVASDSGKSVQKFVKLNQ